MHTFSISKVISNNDYYRIYKHIKNWQIIRKSYCITYLFSDYGISKLVLWRIKTDPTYYMLEITINPNKMLGGTGNCSTSITDINEILMQQIYHVIDELLPELDNNNPQIIELQKELENVQSQGDNKIEIYRIKKDILFLKHQYKLRRIDFSCDIVTKYKKEYIQLINKGFPIKHRRMKQMLYEREAINDEKDEFDEYEDINIDEEQSEEQADNNLRLNSVYWKGKSTTINIYDKYEELKKNNSSENEMEYMRNILRIEIQVKVNKLKSIVRNSDEIDNRELLKVATLEKERELIIEYLDAIVRKGNYMRLSAARKEIRNSGYKKSKQDRLINVLKEIQISGGIENFLKKVKDGYRKLGELSTIKTYLRDLQTLGINPVLIPDDMQFDKNMLLNPVTIVQGYYEHLSKEIKEYHETDSVKTHIE